MTDLVRLRALLGTPEAEWILIRLRSRLESGRPLLGTITRREPTEAERSAITRMLGTGETVSERLVVDLDDVDHMLRHAGICDGLTAAAEVLIGPTSDRRAARDLLESRWRGLFDSAASRLAGDVELEQWLTEVRERGLLRRVSRQDLAAAEMLVEQIFALRRLLPARGVAIAEVAATVAGDSHALDAGAPLGTLAARLALIVGKFNLGERTLRDVWASVGVLCDELSAPVLVLGVAAATNTAAGRALAVHADAGEPYRLSVRQMLRTPPPDFACLAGRVVFVCENPTVVAAAANQLSSASAPLVCVEGQPRTAARLLLERLVATSARLVYHGDFDWGGIRIGNVLVGRFGARPWRFGVVDYQRAPAGRVLRGKPVEAMWDVQLSTALRARGRAIHEEQLLTDLLSDLAT